VRRRATLFRGEASRRVARAAKATSAAARRRLEFIVFGPRHDGDAQLIPDWWTG
jgi:hypothetical protein